MAEPLVVERYHVPRSQVWRGSRGRQSGNVHYHVTRDVAFGRIRRTRYAALCGRRGWYERELYDGEVHTICERCAELLDRLRAETPEDATATMVS